MTTAAFNQSVRQDTHLYFIEKNSTIHYYRKKDEALKGSVIPNSLQKCLESMGKDFSKYDKYKARKEWLKNLMQLLRCMIIMIIMAVDQHCYYDDIIPIFPLDMDSLDVSDIYSKPHHIKFGEILEEYLQGKSLLQKKKNQIIRKGEEDLKCFSDVLTD